MQTLSRRKQERAAKKLYAEVIAHWCSGFDTAETAKMLRVEEWIVAKWVANFRDMMHGAPDLMRTPRAA